MVASRRYYVKPVYAYRISASASRNRFTTLLTEGPASPRFLGGVLPRQALYQYQPSRFTGGSSIYQETDLLKTY